MRMTIRSKLGLAFATVIVLSAATAWLGIRNLAALNETMEDVLTVHVGRMQMAQNLRPDLLEVVRAEKNLLLAGAEQRAPADAELLKQSEVFGQRIDTLYPIASANGKKRLDLLRASHQHWLEVIDRMRSLVRDNQAAEAIALSSGSGQQLVADQEKEIDAYMDLFHTSFAQAKESAAHQYDSTRLLLIAAASIALLVGVTAACWIAFSISRGLRKAITLANAVAGGDLDQKVVVSTNDEIKDVVQALNQMTANLRTTANVADAIAGGDFTMEARRLSDKDALGISLERMTANLRATANVADTIADGDLTTEVKRLSDKDTLGIALERMTTNLRATAKVADAIADGDLTTEVKRLSDKDTLGISLERMTANLRTTAKIADAIGGGDLSTEVKRLSDKDTLGISLERMTTNLRATAKVADAIADGDLTTEVKRLSDKDTLGIALERMTANLRATAKVADTIADGDFSTEARRLSDKDTLGIALERMTTNLRATAKVADAIADGDLTTEAKRLSDKDALGIALERMMSKLRTVVTDASGRSRERVVRQPATVIELRGVVARRHGAGLGGGRGLRLDGADGRQHQTERRQRRPDREDRPSVGRRCATKRRGGGACRSGDADHRREDHHRAGDRPADRPAGAERGGRGSPGRRTRQGLRGCCLRGPQARRTQSDGGGRDRHGFVTDGEGGTGSRRDAEPAGAGHQEDRRTGDRDQRRVPRAGCRGRADQPGDPAARQGDAAERQCVRADVGDLGGTGGAGRATAVQHCVFSDRDELPSRRSRRRP